MRMEGLVFIIPNDDLINKRIALYHDEICVG